MFTLPIVIVTVLLVRRANRYSSEELAEHLTDYPYLALGSEKSN
jgi:putative membrane protein